MTRGEVERRTRLAISLQADGGRQVPAALRLTPGAVRWRADEIEEWIASRPRARATRAGSDDNRTGGRRGCSRPTPAACRRKPTWSATGSRTRAGRSPPARAQVVACTRGKPLHWRRGTMRWRPSACRCTVAQSQTLAAFAKPCANGGGCAAGRQVLSSSCVEAVFYALVSVNQGVAPLLSGRELGTPLASSRSPVPGRRRSRFPLAHDWFVRRRAHVLILPVRTTRLTPGRRVRNTRPGERAIQAVRLSEAAAP